MIEKLNTRIHNLAAEIILYKLSDPRLKFVTVLRAELTRDLQYCTIYVSCLGTEQQKRTTMRALQHARGYIQRQIAPNLKLRHMPRIEIKFDDGAEKSQKMSNLIDEVLKEGKTAEEEVKTAEDSGIEKE